MEKDQPDEVGQRKDTGPSTRKSAAKWPLLGGLGCLLILGLGGACCLVTAILGHQLQQQERERRTGAVAIAREAAKETRAMAKETGEKLKKLEDPRYWAIRHKALLKQAEDIEKGAGKVTNENLLDFLCETSARYDSRVVEGLKELAKGFKPGEDLDYLQSEIKRFSDQSGTRGRLSKWVTETRARLTEKYEKEKREGRGRFSGLAERKPRSSKPETQMGKALKAGSYFEVTVNSCRTSSVVGSGPFATKAGAGNSFLILNVTIRNIDSEARMLTAGRLYAKVNGRELKFDAPEVVLAEGYITLANVNPLTSITGNLAWKIPADLSGEVFWEPSRSSRRVRVR